MPGYISPAGKELSRRLGDEVAVLATGAIEGDRRDIVRAMEALKIIRDDAMS